MDAVSTPYLENIARCLTGDRIYGTRETALTDMQTYMKYYDAIRLHSTLGYQTTMEYKNMLKTVSGLS